MQHSIYLHIPFCTHRCAYCDFNTYAGHEGLIPVYVSALCEEVRYVGERTPGNVSVHTVFFGGGTPSLLRPDQLERVLDAIRGAFRVEAEAEVTLEANPGTVSPAYLEAIRCAGVNRLSLGVQSANGEELRLLERTHDYGEVLAAVSGARRVGFENLNTDLIFGLPEQGMHAWQATVERVLDLRPEHISAYALTLEHGTPFGQWARRGLLPLPDADLAADMYEWLEDELCSRGYRHYEISNWAMDGRQCRHNLQYWRGEPYFGMGAGAHGYVGNLRYSNVLAIRGYVDRFPRSSKSRPYGARGTFTDFEGAQMGPAYPRSPASIEAQQQSVDDEMEDFMIMGLRLTQEGISAGRFGTRFGRNLEGIFGRQISKLVELGLLEKADLSQRDPKNGAGGLDLPADVGVRLTRRGRLLGNRVFAEFINPSTPAPGRASGRSHGTAASVEEN